MKNTRRNDRSGGQHGGFSKRRDFDHRGGGRRFGGHDDGGPQMHQATCADCGQSCEVPFRPTGDRPVYCSNCFGKHRDNDGTRPERRRDERPRWEEKRMFRATCDNCHQSCEVPFRPSGDKPVYCSDCFEKMGKGGTQTRRTESGGPGGQKDLTGQFKQLNAKLDAILSALTIKPAAIQEKKPAKTAAVKSPKASKKKRAK